MQGIVILEENGICVRCCIKLKKLKFGKCFCKVGILIDTASWEISIRWGISKHGRPEGDKDV